MNKYDHQKIEQEARARFEAAAVPTDLTDDRDPYYLLFEFPYPSGDLHVGHWYAYALTDVYARFLRAKGKNVLFPIGFDAFGLPAENAAMKYGKTPREWTYGNMEKMREQIRSIGTSVDWSKEVITCEPSYYRWTQWLFIKLFEHNLAYRKEGAVKWCPKDQTVLANEQVSDGACERCGTPVEEKRLTQWFLKITDYAERLLADLEKLPWREDIKDAQRAWIGKSEGAKISFAVKGIEDGADLSTIDVFTTRPDTLFGVTYVVLAPEHPLVLGFSGQEKIAAYLEATKKKSEIERMENKEKTGVRIEGITAVNPVNGEEVPVFVADYVLGSYGTGAVMAVPAHDERDFAFAKSNNLPIRQVIVPVRTDFRNPHQEGKETVERNATINVVYDPKTNKYLCLKWKHEPWTTFITGGVEVGEDPEISARREIAEETGYTDLTRVGNLGQSQSNFYASHKGVNRIANNTLFLFELASDAQEKVSEEEEAKHDRVWLSREEIEQVGMQHSEFDIIWRRVLARGLDAYTDDGILINSGAFSGKKNTEAAFDIVEAAQGARTTNYRVRDWLVSRQRYWGCPIPVVYDPEGKPHAIPPQHLPWELPTDVDFVPNGKAPLASSKELHERVTRIFGEGWTPEYDTLDTFVDSSWYFLRYLDPENDHEFASNELMKKWLPVNRYSGGSEHTTMHLFFARFLYKALHDLALVPTDEPFLERMNRGLIMGPDGQKMSKSRGNVVNPDEVVKEFGADAVRLYLAFIGPYNEPGNYPWKPEGVFAMRKFLDRIHALSARVTDIAASENLMRALAAGEVKTAADIERFKLNTAVSALMVALKSLEAEQEVPRQAYHEFLRMLAPFAPHLADYLFLSTGGQQSIHATAWPVYDAALLVSDEVTIAVQVNGKRRAEVTVSKDTEQHEVLAKALQEATVSNALGGKELARVIFVPNKLLNIVV